MSIYDPIAKRMLSESEEREIMRAEFASRHRLSTEEAAALLGIPARTLEEASHAS